LNKRKDLNGEKNYPSRLRGRGVDFDRVKSFYLIGKFSKKGRKKKAQKGL